jgi:hypothetical protein
MGLLVSVYQFPLGDCTNKGISSGVRDLCLVNVDGPFNPSSTAPAAFLVKGNGQGLVKIVPAAKNDEKWQPATGWWMMGGNFGATSDSRFHQAVEAITGSRSYGAVPIHDRME